MMLSIIKAIALATLFGYQASAVSLRIYTPAQYDFGILTLKEDWTIDSTTRDGFVAMNKDYAQRTIPKGEGNMFALTGMMTWTGDTFDKRAFWMVAEEGDDYRQQTKCTVRSTQPLTDDVYVYLSPPDWTEDMSWTDKGKCDTLDIGWVHCIGGRGEWNDNWFMKPDDTDLGPTGKKC